MTDYIRVYETKDPKILAKEVVLEVLNPEKTVNNLTKKEKIKQEAELKSKE